MKPILLLLFCAVLFCSCESSENLSRDFPSTLFYSIQVTDSVEIPTMSAYGTVLSVHPVSNDILVHTSEGNQSILFHLTEHGDLIRRFVYPTEGPASAGSLLMSAEFWEDGYAIMGYGSIVVYDAQFEPLQRIPISQDLFGMIYEQANHMQTLRQGNENKLLIFYGQETPYNVTQQEFYDHFHMLSVVDVEEKRFQPYGFLHQESMFKQGRAFYFMRPFYQTSGEQTRVVMQRDTILYLFDASGKEVQRTKIPFDDYIIFKGYTMGRAGLDEQEKPGDMPGNILTYLHVDGIDLIRYTSGLPLERVESIRGDDSKDQRELAQELRQANPYKILLMKDGQRISTDVQLPARVGNLSAADKNGTIWASQNVNALDEEPEFLTLYKLRIVPTLQDE